MTGIPTAALIACAVIVLALGALLSAGESALLRFTRAAADDLIEEGHRGAARVRRLAEHRTRVLGALSVARVAVDMLAAVLITLAAGHSAVEEMLLLTVHGILHLLGYDHAEPEEKKEMFDLQRRLLLTFLAERGK